MPRLILEPAAPAPMSWAEAEISSMIFEIHDLNIEAGNDVAFCHCLTGAVEQKQTAKKRLRGCARPSVIARQTDTGWSCINIGRRLLTWRTARRCSTSSHIALCPRPKVGDHHSRIVQGDGLAQRHLRER
jgi:hypothetical protein